MKDHNGSRPLLWNDVDLCLTGANIEWKCLETSVDHVKISSDDSAVEAAKEKEDCDHVSPESFQRRLNRQVYH